MAFTFTTAGTIITGWGASRELGAVAAKLGQRALLLTGRSALRETGALERLTDSLKSAGVGPLVVHRVQPEPSVDAVDAARAVFHEGHCDLVVAAGGGSVMDVGKAVAVLAGEVAPTADYFDARKVPTRAFPCIVLPTTAGSGAEVTANSVLVDPRARIKQSIRGPALLPTTAIVDAELTASCQPDVTASAGMDALAQAVESYWSLGASPLTDALAVYAAELVWLNILAAYQNGQDREAREAMSYAALLAGMALANARLGAIHGIAHPLGCRYGIRHGAVCAALLPHVMRFNRQVASEKYEVLCAVFGGDAADATASLLISLSLPARLSYLGVRQADFGAIAAESLPSGSLQANPRPVTAQDVKDILAAAM